MPILKDNLKQLYYFYESVKNNNISNAAKKLFISQPAISMQIKKLENCCGMKLIGENDCKKIQPTPEGRKLYEYNITMQFNYLKSRKVYEFIVLYY